jgi:hypothetical protein
MKRTVVLFGFVCFAILAGCANNNTPSAVARKFYTALGKNDMKALGQVSTPETVQVIAMFGEKVPGMVAAYGKITETSEEIEGDTALVFITFESGETEELTLQKINNQWKVIIDKS